MLSFNEKFASTRFLDNWSSTKTVMAIMKNAASLLVFFCGVCVNVFCFFANGLYPKEIPKWNLGLFFFFGKPLVRFAVFWKHGKCLLFMVSGHLRVTDQ